MTGCTERNQFNEKGIDCEKEFNAKQTYYTAL
jgi:hypothetical protein